MRRPAVIASVVIETPLVKASAPVQSTTNQAWRPFSFAEESTGSKGAARTAMDCHHDQKFNEGKSTPELVCSLARMD